MANKKNQSILVYGSLEEKQKHGIAIITAAVVTASSYYIGLLLRDTSCMQNSLVVS